MMFDLTKNTGVLPPPTEGDHAQKEYLMGGLSGIVHEKRNTTGDWRSFAPIGETQRHRFFDDFGCASHSTENCLECQFKFFFKSILLRNEDIQWLKDNGYFVDGEINFDDRWLVVLSGTRPGVGNYLHAVWDAARKYGLVPQGSVPFRENMTQGEYYIKTDFPQKAYDLGQEFLKRFLIQYERVNVNEKDLKKALEQAPLHVGIPTCSGWFDGATVQYCSANANHAVIVTCIDELKKYITDSYEPFSKQVVRNYKIDFAYKGVISPVVSVSGENKKDQYSFQKDLRFGHYDNEVTQLCKRLILEDCLPNWNPGSPHYGPEVADGVLRYQQKTNCVSWWEKVWLRGCYFGKKTRFSMNMTNPNLF